MDGSSSLLPLPRAVSDKNTEEVMRLLSEGHDPNALGPDDCTSLHFAAILPDDKGVDYIEPLLRYKAEINRKSYFGSTALLMAMSHQNWKTCKLLLQFGADVNICEVDGDTPLHYLAKADGQEDLNLVRDVLEAGLNVDSANEKGETPLLVAVQARNESKVRLFLEKGASPDKEDCHGHSSLAMSCENLDFEMFNLMCPFSKGVIGYVNKHGRNFLHYLFALNIKDQDHLEVSRFVDRLLELGASLNVANNDGELPLHLALKNAPAPVAKKIIELTSKDAVIQSAIEFRSHYKPKPHVWRAYGLSVTTAAAKRNEPLIFEAIKSKCFPKVVLETPFIISNPADRHSTDVIISPIAYAVSISGHLPLTSSPVPILVDFGIALDPVYDNFKLGHRGSVSAGVLRHAEHHQDMACHCLETIKFLLESGADPDFGPEDELPRAYLIAAVNNLIDILSLLLQYSRKMSVDPLIDGLSTCMGGESTSFPFHNFRYRPSRSYFLNNECIIPWFHFLCLYSVGIYRQLLPEAWRTFPSLKEICRNIVRKDIQQYLVEFKSFKEFINDHFPIPVANFLLYSDLDPNDMPS